MGSVTFELNETIAARWRRGLKGADEHEDGQDRAHWRTKVSYYRAMEDHLVLAPSPPLTWDAIVSMVRPRGSRTTFYDVIGAKAAHPLLGEYEADRGGYGEQIAALYPRGSAVQKLIDETKVWSFWGHRTGWLKQLERAPDITRRVAAECLIRVLANWAATHPQIAAALSCVPPMCAVEDLLVVGAFSGTAADAAEMLADVITYALGPLGAITDGVLRAVKGQLHQPSARDNRARDDALSALAEASYTIIRDVSAMPAAMRTTTRDAAVKWMEDAIATLNQLG